MHQGGDGESLFFIVLRAVVSLILVAGACAFVYFFYYIWSHSAEWAAADRAAEKAQSEQTVKNLPAGCTLTSGPYYGRRLIVVTCDGRKTTTMNESHREGKYTRQSTTVTVQ
jgi:hypothetical protein